MIKFTPAKKEAAKLRLAISGPSGSGKTYTALQVARFLGARVAVLDSEHGSAAKYADIFGFDSFTPDTFSPNTYTEAVHAAEQAGYDVIVLDSLTHAWAGKGGALEMVDAASNNSRGNKFAGWRDVTPAQQAMVDAIVGSKIHVIATMRTKTEWVLEEDNRGKKVPRKVGTAPVQRDQIEYEFDLAGELDLSHNLTISKSRCPKLSGAIIPQPGEQLARDLLAWLSAPQEAPRAAAAPSPAPTPASPPAAAAAVPGAQRGPSSAPPSDPRARLVAEIGNWVKIVGRDVASQVVPELAGRPMKEQPLEMLMFARDALKKAADALADADRKDAQSILDHSGENEPR